MQNISNSLSTENNSSLETDNSSNTSSLSYCKTCNIIGDDTIITYHKYNCPKKQLPCNKCLKEVSIQEIPMHKNICEEQEVEYYFATRMFNTFMIKKSILSSIKLAEEILNDNYDFSESEKIKIYKKAIVAYNQLIDKFNSKSFKNIEISHEILSYNQYKKIVDMNIRLEKNQLSLQATMVDTSTLDADIKDEITKKYLQKKIKYKIYNLPEVEITIKELLHIKLAKVKASCNISNAMDDFNIADSENDLLFYQQAVTIYKELIANLEMNKLREKREFNEWLDLVSKIKKQEASYKNYCITDKVKVEVPEKPLITQNFQLHFSKDNDIFNDCLSGKLFSLLSVNKLQDSVLHTFKPSLLCFIDKTRTEYDITIKISSTANYHTDEDKGIYILYTKDIYANFMERRDIAGTTYKLAISYIDENNYKNFIFDVCFSAKELFENACCTDEFDNTTKFGFVNRSKKMKKLNRFFNNDGIGTEYIKKHGCDSIFAIEFYRSKQK